ncbi:hypothetical protein [Ruegeria atlantica]|uniref:hypothetical protein n=1 Tax=Ruegeria atlantica TaxID=81569 RepID=UPI00147F0477|nr:hypothetical protein [Ruegeria atlantica]
MDTVIRNGSLTVILILVWMSLPANGEPLKNLVTNQQQKVIQQFINWHTSGAGENKHLSGTREHLTRQTEIATAFSQLPYVSASDPMKNGIAAEYKFVREVFGSSARYEAAERGRAIENWRCVFKGAGLQTKNGGWLVSEFRFPEYIDPEYNIPAFSCITPYHNRQGRVALSKLLERGASSFVGVGATAGYFPLRIYTKKGFTKTTGLKRVYLNDFVEVQGVVSCAIGRDLGCGIAAKSIRFLDPGSVTDEETRTHVPSANPNDVCSQPEFSARVIAVAERVFSKMFEGDGAYSMVSCEYSNDVYDIKIIGALGGETRTIGIDTSEWIFAFHSRSVEDPFSSPNQHLCSNENTGQAYISNDVSTGYFSCR